MRIKDWANRLIFATILITVVRYMGAFASSDLGRISGVLSEIFTFLLALSGLGMGLLDVLGGGLLFNGWKNVMPRTGDKWSFKFKVLTFCVFGLVISGLVIIVPFTVSRMSQESIIDTLGGRLSIFTWLWATMVVIVPYLLIAGVFVGNKMVEGLETESSNRKLPEISNISARQLPSPKGKTRWGEIPIEKRSQFPSMTEGQIVSMYGGTPRRARMWKQWVREENK